MAHGFEYFMFTQSSKGAITRSCDAQRGSSPLPQCGRDISNAAPALASPGRPLAVLFICDCDSQLCVTAAAAVDLCDAGPAGPCPSTCMRNGHVSLQDSEQDYCQVGGGSEEGERTLL